jgi:hypothetical protein
MQVVIIIIIIIIIIIRGSPIANDPAHLPLPGGPVAQEEVADPPTLDALQSHLLGIGHDVNGAA